MIETSDSDAWIPLQRTADEEHALRSVEHELRAEFPWVPVDQVTILVECLLAQFDGVPVRDYVPLLVWKQAKEELLDHPASRAETVREPRRAPAAAHPWLVSVPPVDNAP